MNIQIKHLVIIETINKLTLKQESFHIHAILPFVKDENKFLC